jgi:hypothetical protein
MLRKLLVVLTTAAIASAFLAHPADAAKKAKKRYPAAVNTNKSLDGRVLGYPRTCGHAHFVYDGWGVPEGPYCH